MEGHGGEGRVKGSLPDALLDGIRRLFYYSCTKTP